MGLITEWIQKKSNKGSKVENKVWKYRKEECRAKTRLTGCILNKNEEKWRKIEDKGMAHFKCWKKEKKLTV